METATLKQILAMSLKPEKQTEAEEILDKLKKLMGFPPYLLLFLVQRNIPLDIRQAGSIMFKHIVGNNFHVVYKVGQPMKFTLHEKDCQKIEQIIIDCTVKTEDIIRNQLVRAVCIIAERDVVIWKQFMNECFYYLKMPYDIAPSHYIGAICCMYNLFKLKYRSQEKDLLECTKIIFPIVQKNFILCFQEESENSVEIQRYTLKLYFQFIQVAHPVEFCNNLFNEWFESVCFVAARPLAAVKKSELPKKWALAVLICLVESMDNCVLSGELNEWYIRVVPTSLVQTMLTILNEFKDIGCSKPNIIKKTIHLLRAGIQSINVSSLLDQHMFCMVQQCILPILSFTTADEELYRSDPIQYMYMKLEFCESSVYEATGEMLRILCKKNKELLGDTWCLIEQIISSPESAASQKDGSMTMLGFLAECIKEDPLLQRRTAKLLEKYVYPELTSSYGHLRAKVCWVIQQFIALDFKEETVLKLTRTLEELLRDEELIVKLMAAVSLQEIIICKKTSQFHMKMKMKNIILEMMQIVKETKNTDVTKGLQKLTQNTKIEIIPIVLDLSEGIVKLFEEIVDVQEGTDEGSKTSVENLKMWVHFLKGSPDSVETLFPLILQILGIICEDQCANKSGEVEKEKNEKTVRRNRKKLFQKRRRLRRTKFEKEEFYDAALSMLTMLTSEGITAALWESFSFIQQIFQKTGFQFPEMFQILYNFITLGTPMLLANKKYMLIILEMCKSVSSSDRIDEETECYGAKLLEVLVTNCWSNIKECLHEVVEIVFLRLNKEVESSEIHNLYLNVIVSATFLDAERVFDMIKILQISVSQFLTFWFGRIDTFLGIHNRKVSLLGMSSLLHLTITRPVEVADIAGKIIPAILRLHNGLELAYEEKNAIDDQYLIGVPKEDGENNEDEETDTFSDLEVFTTSLDEIDEKIILSEKCKDLHVNDPCRFDVLLSELTSEDKKVLYNLMFLGEQRKTASVGMEQSGDESP